MGTTAGGRGGVRVSAWLIEDTLTDMSNCTLYAYVSASM